MQGGRVKLCPPRKISGAYHTIPGWIIGLNHILLFDIGCLLHLIHKYHIDDAALVLYRCVVAAVI